MAENTLIARAQCPLNSDHCCAVITPGEDSERVHALQALIGTAPGPWGFLDVAALMSYQQDHGQPVTGVP